MLDKKKLIILTALTAILILMPVIIKSITYISLDRDPIIRGGINEELGNDARPSSYYISDLNITERKSIYLQSANKSNGINAQCAKVYLNETDINNYNVTNINKSIDKINSREDCSDFDMNALLRMMYLDKGKNNIPKNINESIKDAVLNFKYWFTEPGSDEMIFWTENHEILFHTAELLAGQLFSSQIFNNTGWNGTQHVDHALPLVNRWLDWRAKFGFAEWHSNIYYRLDLTALLNLADFAENETIAEKAKMIIDLIGFDFANNYYKGAYATAHGRTEDEKQFGTSMNNLPERESTAEPAWVMLGIGTHDSDSGDNSAAVFLSTGNYSTPPILEKIANATATADKYIHKSRNSIDISEGLNTYGIGHSTRSDLMFWWPMSAPAAPPILKSSLDLIDKYDLDPALVFNDESFVDLFELGSILHGTSLNKYSELISDITKGVALETANTYTYKTPNYQLSGVQDHQKGMNGLQELIWQACLDRNATVYTSSPSALSTSDQQFSSGWKPRATLHENVGIIQYDRRMGPLEMELVMQLLEEPSYTHAYFPQWAFNEWNQTGNWVFGRRNNSYIGLYSYNSIEWKENYEIRADGKKNVWIVELGSSEDEAYDSYQDFVNSLLGANILISEQSMGYAINYNSPTQGSVKVSWDGPMYVNNQKRDLGPYDRFENNYCNQTFGDLRTQILFKGMNLTLDFNTVERIIK